MPFSAILLFSKMKDQSKTACFIHGRNRKAKEYICCKVVNTMLTWFDYSITFFINYNLQSYSCKKSSNQLKQTDKQKN